MKVSIIGGIIHTTNLSEYSHAWPAPSWGILANKGWQQFLPESEYIKIQALKKEYI